jgi:hypothetical protein
MINNFKFIVFSGLIILTLNSFRYQTKLEDKLVGVWIFNVAEGEQLTYNRAKELKEDVGGYKFKKDDKLIYRQNMSWCGTSPISYKNYDGRWEISPDSVITITSGYYGGESEKKLKLISIDNHTLKAVYIESHRIEKPVMLLNKTK